MIINEKKNVIEFKSDKFKMKVIKNILSHLISLFPSFNNYLTIVQSVFSLLLYSTFSDLIP